MSSKHQIRLICWAVLLATQLVPLLAISIHWILGFGWIEHLLLLMLDRETITDLIPLLDFVATYWFLACALALLAAGIASFGLMLADRSLSTPSKIGWTAGFLVTSFVAGAFFSAQKLRGLWSWNARENA